MKAVKTPVAEAVENKAQQFEALFGFSEESNVQVPALTWKRVLTSVVAQFVVVASGYYAGVQLAAVLSVAAMTLTGSTFLAFVIAFVAIAVSVFYALISAGQFAKYIVSGGIDDDYQRAKGWVRGLFGKSEVSAPEELNADYSAVKQSVKRKVTRVRDAKDEMISRMRKGVSHV